MKRLLTVKTQSIFSAALVLGAASFLSRLIGVIRSRIFADQFGAGETLDIYFAAFKIPDMMFQLLVLGALSAGFIPVFMRRYVKSKDEAWELTNSLLSLLFVALLVLCALLFVLMPWLTPFIVPGFDIAAQDHVTQLSRIMLLSPIILGVSSIIGGVLQATRAFFAYALAPIAYNIGIIIGAVYFVEPFGIAGLAYGVILGALFHVLIQLPSLLDQGYRLRWRWSLQDPDLKKIGRLMIPRTLAIATSQLNFLVMTIVASTLAVGSITVFTFANDLQYFAVGTIGVSFALAAFPAFSELEAREEHAQMRMHFMATVRKVLLLIIPTTVVFLVLRAQIVRVVFGSGAFDWADTIATADALAFFSLSLFAQALIPLLTRMFYALHNTTTPLLIAFISSLINIIGCLALKDSLGVAGLALAFSASSVLQGVLLWLSLRKVVGGLGESQLLPLLYKVSLATLAMAFVMQGVKTWLGEHPVIDMTRFWGILTQGAIAGSAGVVVFLVTMHMLRVNEVRRATQWIIGVTKSIFGHRTQS